MNGICRRNLVVLIRLFIKIVSIDRKSIFNPFRIKGQSSNINRVLRYRADYLILINVHQTRISVNIGFKQIKHSTEQQAFIQGSDVIVLCFIHTFPGILDFLKVYDAYYDYILRALTQTGRLAPAPVAERLSLARELLQQGLSGEEWAPYLAWLWGEGARLAEAGQSLPEAIKNVGAARAEVLPYVWELYGHDLRRQASAVRGLTAPNELYVSVVAAG